MEKKILILDIETTGFLNNGGKIVEIGIVELDLENGTARIIFDEVMHEKGITLKEVQESWIVSNSSLTMEMIRHSKNLELYREEIQNIIYKYPLGITAFNKTFDFDFFEDRDFEIPEKLGCPMALSKNIVRAKNKRGALKNPNIEEAYKSLVGDGYIEEHRGADDALHEAEIVYELYLRGVFKVDESKITKLPEVFEGEPVDSFEFKRVKNHNQLIKFLQEIDDENEFKLSNHGKITNPKAWADVQVSVLDNSESQHQYNATIEIVRRFKKKYKKT